MYLALGQVPIILGNVAENLNIMEKTIVNTQKEKSIDLIAFPELFITGYNLKDNYNNVSEVIPGNGQAQEGIKEIAKKHDVTILTGIVERANKSLFNSAFFVLLKLS